MFGNRRESSVLRGLGVSCVAFASPEALRFLVLVRSRYFERLSSNRRSVCGDFLS